MLFLIQFNWILIADLFTFFFRAFLYCYNIEIGKTLIKIDMNLEFLTLIFSSPILTDPPETLPPLLFFLRQMMFERTLLLTIVNTKQL